MAYQIYETESFIRLYSKLSCNEKQWIEDIKESLKISPNGKILRFEWFREKKYLNKRLFLL